MSQPASPRTVLVADDDLHIVELVSLYLRRAGFTVRQALDGEETLRMVREDPPSLLVLDVMMPGQDGFQVCRALAHREAVPIIFLTARSSDIDRIAGLRMGADDYVVKPFNPEELVARVEAVLRRSQASAGRAAPAPVRLAALELDPGSRIASVGGRALPLTPREFDLLSVLVRFPGVVLHREQLLDLAWGTAFYSVRTVNVHVARLRDKLQGSGLRIETSWGTGYRLAEEGT